MTDTITERERLVALLGAARAYLVDHVCPDAVCAACVALLTAVADCADILPERGEP